YGSVARLAIVQPAGAAGGLRGAGNEIGRGTIMSPGENDTVIGDPGHSRMQPARSRTATLVVSNVSAAPPQLDPESVTVEPGRPSHRILGENEKVPACWSYTSPQSSAFS